MKYDAISFFTIKGEENKTTVTFDGVTGGAPNPLNYRITVEEITYLAESEDGPNRPIVFSKMTVYTYGDFEEAKISYRSFFDANI